MVAKNATEKDLVRNRKPLSVLATAIFLVAEASGNKKTEQRELSLVLQSLILLLSFLTYFIYFQTFYGLFKFLLNMLYKHLGNIVKILI